MSGETRKHGVINDIYSNNNETKWIDFPFKIADVDDETNGKLLADFTGERTGFVQVGPKKWFFPSGYKKNAEIYYNFQARPDDIWIVTFPRSGTTWTQEMVWLLTNKLDYKTASEIPLEARFPFLEFSCFMHPEVKQEFLDENSSSDGNCALIEEISTPAWEKFEQTHERRFIKTHLPFQLLPPNLLEVGCKVIYIARNPKDVAVSFYHLNRLFRTQGYLRDFPKYWNYFEKGLQPWTPYWPHIEEGWERRNEENLLFLFYEDMNKVDLGESIRKVSTFLGTNYYSNDEIAALKEHLKIDNFKNNKSVNFQLLKDLGIILKSEEGFVRKGKSGGWKDYLFGELNDRADKWMIENLKKTDLQFPQTYK